MRSIFERPVSRKGQMGGLYNAVLVIGLVVILGAIVALILSTIAADPTVAADGNSLGIIQDGQAALTTIFTWLGIIALVIAAGIVLFYVLRSFRGGQGGP